MSASAPVNPIQASSTSPALSSRRAQMTALAARHMDACPAFFSLSLKMGMNAAVSAPSPSSRRNRFGTCIAKMKASATGPSPMNAAKADSRRKPSTRLMSVAAPTAPEDFSIRDMSRGASGLRRRGQDQACRLGSQRDRPSFSPVGSGRISVSSSLSDRQEHRGAMSAMSRKSNSAATTPPDSVGQRHAPGRGRRSVDRVVVWHPFLGACLLGCHRGCRCRSPHG